MNITKFRDLTLIHINEEQIMAIACDSSGGIGDKEFDVVKVAPEIVGFYTTQVCLMEILAIGAEPITVVNALAVEMDPCGKGIIRGVKRALEPLNLPDDKIVTGTTEENIPVCQTAIGMTIIGIINKSEFRKTTALKGDIAVVVGIPKVGDDVIADQGKEILTIELLLKLKAYTEINEILPVGSKGILYELGEMATTNNLDFEVEEDVSVDIYKSAGPGTCAIISLNEKDYPKIKENFPIPLNRIGKFI